jgi:septum formation protein
MGQSFILASASDVRLRLLLGAGLRPVVMPARVDEYALMAALLADGASPRDIADTLAEMKARKVSERHRQALVLGCDQVLALGSRLLTKPQSPDDAVGQLKDLRGRTHDLFSALVLYDEGRPIWRHIGEAQLTMRVLTDAEIKAYVAENWDSIQHAVGCYKIEEAGQALFSAVKGDRSTIQGLPLAPLTQYLTQRGHMTA